MIAPTPPIRAIGIKAHRALLRSAGRIDVVVRLQDACYVRAGGEILCVTERDVAMHPRVVVVACLERIAGGLVGVDKTIPWRPPAAPPADEASIVHARAQALRRDIVDDAARGFAAMLGGKALAFPIDRARADVERLARATRGDDPQAACDAALPLLGLGSGFTPSGDDLVGALFFARRALANATAAARRWAHAAHRLCAASEARTHPIAAALLRDLADVASFAPLHALVAALAAGHEPPGRAARALVAIGHSSGWDMLAGVLIATSGDIGAHSIPAAVTRSGAESTAQPEPTGR